MALAPEKRTHAMAVWHACHARVRELGRATSQFFGLLCYWSAILGTLLLVGIRPSHWRRTVRRELACQILLIGVESLRFIAILAVLVGMTVVVQAQLWVERLGQSHKLGTLLVVVVARELGPLFANVVVLVKSGSVITTELGVMKSSGEIRLLEAQGIEPFLYLLMPRVVGLAISTFCLAIIFNVLTFLSGFFYGSYISHTAAEPLGFVDNVFTSFRGIDAVNILLKSLVPPLLMGIICCTEGLNITAGISEVPLATKRALSRSLVALFVISAAVSLISYG